MPAINDIARGMIASIGSTVDVLIASKWVIERYQQLCNRAYFKHLRRIGTLTIPAPITAGTVSATRGSRTITPNATALAAWGSFVIGRHIRIKTVWYEITQFAGGVITLASEFAEDNQSAVSYRIVQRYVSLASDARRIGAFVHPRRRSSIGTISLAELDTIAPSRPSVTPGPAFVAEVEKDPSGARRVEFYPYSDLTEQILYTYWPSAPVIDIPNGHIDDAIDPYVLREGAMIDLFMWEAGRSMRTQDINGAGFWRNQSLAQRSIWEKVMLDALESDKGLDDATFILQSNEMTHLAGDITNARDQVLSQWPR